MYGSFLTSILKIETMKMKEAWGFLWRCKLKADTQGSTSVLKLNKGSPLSYIEMGLQIEINKSFWSVNQSDILFTFAGRQEYYEEFVQPC